MDGFLGFSLVGDVFFDHFPVPPLGNGGQVKPVAPEFTTPQLFLELGKSPEELFGRQAFENPDHVTAAILRWKGDEKVDMVKVNPDLFKLQVVTEGDFLGDLGDGERDLVSQQRLAVLDGKNNMVMRVVNVMVCPVEGHALIL